VLDLGKMPDGGARVLLLSQFALADPEMIKWSQCRGGFAGSEQVFPLIDLGILNHPRHISAFVEQRLGVDERVVGGGSFGGSEPNGVCFGGRYGWLC